jgi:hypothetical protein
MNATVNKKLKLNRETVRALQNSELQQVAGGRRPPFPQAKYLDRVPTGGVCSACYCPSGSTGAGMPTNLP